MAPKREKYRKRFRGRQRGVASRGTRVSFGEYGLKSVGRGWLTERQIEAARRAITHSTSRGGKVWIRVFPDKPISSRPAGVRMGGGKGDVAEHVVVVTPGRVLFEVAGISEELVHEAFKKADAKIPFETKIVQRD